MGVYSIFSRENLSNLKPPKAEVIKDILHDIATPIFEQMNIHATKNPYIWMGDYNDEGIRKIIQFSYRGSVVHLSVGTNFEFIPLVNSKQKISYRRDKLHLFESSKVIVKSRRHISLWNEKLFISSLKKFVDKRGSRIEKYLSNMNTVQQNIKIARTQLQHPYDGYMIHYPELTYVLPFLYAKLGDTEKATQLLEAHIKQRESLPRKIFDYLDKV